MNEILNDNLDITKIKPKKQLEQVSKAVQSLKFGEKVQIRDHELKGIKSALLVGQKDEFNGRKSPYLILYFKTTKGGLLKFKKLDLIVVEDCIYLIADKSLKNKMFSAVYLGRYNPTEDKKELMKEKFPELIIP